MKKIVAAMLVTTFVAGSAFAQSTTTVPANSSTSATSTLVTTLPHLGADQMVSSKVVGASVYNTNNDKVGEVNDLIVDANGRVAYVVIGVGGFLGIGERNVAISFASVTFTKDKNGKDHVAIAATKDQLKAMVPYEGAKTGG